MFKNTAESLVADRNRQNSCSTLGTYSAEYTQNRKFSKWLWQLWEQVQFSKVKAPGTGDHVEDNLMTRCPGVHCMQIKLVHEPDHLSPLSPPAISTSSLVTSVALHICGLFFPLFFFKESNYDVENRHQNLNLTSNLCLTSTIKYTFHLAAANVRYWLLLEQVKHTVYYSLVRLCGCGAGRSSWYISWK